MCEIKRYVFRRSNWGSEENDMLFTTGESFLMCCVNMKAFQKSMNAIHFFGHFVSVIYLTREELRLGKLREGPCHRGLVRERLPVRSGNCPRDMCHHESFFLP